MTGLCMQSCFSLAGKMIVMYGIRGISHPKYIFCSANKIGFMQCIKPPDVIPKVCKRNKERDLFM